MGIFLSLAFAFLWPVHAQVFEGPVSSSLSGSGRAGLDANEGVFLNPALGALLSKSEIAGYFQDGYADSGEHQHAIGASISQNDDDVLCAGTLSYLQTRDTGIAPQPTDGKLWHGSLSKLFFKKLSIGLSAYSYSLKPVGQPMTDQWNGAVGAVYQIIHNLGVAYVFDNPVHASSLVPTTLRLIPEQSLGVYYNTPFNATLRLDVLRWEQQNPGQRWNVHPSIETDLSDFFKFRVGARWDEIQDQTFVTAGLGFNGPGLKIDYALMKNMEHTGGAVQSVDMRTSF